jgi:hypothetical protein
LTRNRTPAPLLTALAHSYIWSGVGEVKTSPGQAPSSIPMPTKSAVHRFVTAAATGDEGDLAGDRGVGPVNIVRFIVNLQHVRVGGGHPFQLFFDDVRNSIDQFFHGFSSRIWAGFLKGDALIDADDSRNPANVENEVVRLPA